MDISLNPSIEFELFLGNRLREELLLFQSRCFVGVRVLAKKLKWRVSLKEQNILTRCG